MKDILKNNLLKYDDFKSGFLNYFDENDGHMMSIVGYNDDKNILLLEIHK